MNNSWQGGMRLWLWQEMFLDSIKKDLDLTHIEDLVKFFRRLLLKREEDEAKTWKAAALHDS